MLTIADFVVKRSCVRDLASQSAAQCCTRQHLLLLLVLVL